MGRISTYSFEAITGTINLSGLVPISFNGIGTGSIDISMATDKSSHDVAADGSVMVSKILGDNGTVSISVQQTSPLHKYLLAWYNYLKVASASEWASSTITIRDGLTGETTVCTGVSPQKIPDKPYKAQGQQMSWSLMAADIQQVPM